MYTDYLIKNQDDSSDAVSQQGPVSFIKMHGLGNDFVIIDQRDKVANFPPQVVKHICDRNFGVGCDQLIVLRHSDNFDCQMLIFNTDGSIGRACGNACRCVAKLLDQDSVSIQIHDRVVNVTRDQNGNFAANMGVPLCDWYQIPLKHEVANDHGVIALNFDEFGGKTGYCLNIGNPHLVFFVDKALTAGELKQQGAFFESHAEFPDRVNVSFAVVCDQSNIELQVWERGAGATLACGSAACATYFVAQHNELVPHRANINIKQRGGNLQLSLNADGQVIMSGGASHSFTGEFELPS